MKRERERERERDNLLCIEKNMLRMKESSKFIVKKNDNKKRQNK